MPQKTEYWWEFIGHAADPELTGHLLYEEGSAGLDLSNPSELRCFFYGTEGAAQRFSNAAVKVGFQVLHRERLPIKNWSDEAERDWHSIHVGDLILSPLVEPEDGRPLPSSNPLQIFIHPNSGFGTGHHVTTIASLELLLSIRNCGATRILDVGTGSGVLAMAACRLMNAVAEGIDQDADTLEYARKNIFLNGFADRISISMRTLAALTPPFQLILANVYNEFHQQNEAEYRRLLSPGGLIVLSGIDRDSQTELSRAFEAHWEPGQSIQMGKWITRLMKLKQP